MEELDTILLQGKSLSELFIGPMGANRFIFSTFLVLLGVLLWSLYRIKNRKDKSSPLSFKVWVNHPSNILAIPIALILTYISVRFYSDYRYYIIQQLPAGIAQLTPYGTMVVVGFLQHYISEKLSKFSLK